MYKFIGYGVLKGKSKIVDGDELNMELLLDREEHDNFYRLSPHLYLLDTQEPRKVSSFVKIPAPVMQTIINFIHEFD